LVSDDGSIAIIPNSAFISSTVVNKGDRPGDTSVAIDVTVLGCASAAAARDMLLGRLVTCDAVDAGRMPQLHLRTLRENWWKFGIRFYPHGNTSQDQVLSDLLFHLGEDCEEGVTILAG
jgi:potassium-dependent mechanosensitive channel